MNWRHLVRERLGRGTAGDVTSDDVVEELAEHLEQRYEEVRGSGASDDAAWRRVMAELEDAPAMARAIARDRPPTGRVVAPPPTAGTPRLLADLWSDVRYACRLLAAAPGFAVAAVAILALGIGATTAVFSIVDTVLLQPLPYPAADRVVALWETDRTSGTRSEPGSIPDFIDLRGRASRFDAFGGAIAGDFTVSITQDAPARVAGLYVTDGLLAILGTRARSGRLFTPESFVGSPDRILISTRLARRTFGSDPAAIGATIRVDDRPLTVIGVVPDTADVGVLQWLLAADYARGFADRDARSRVDVWLPLALDPVEFPRQTHPLLMLARTKPGVTMAIAQEEVSGIMTALERAFPENRARGARVQPLAGVVLGPVRPALGALLLAVSLVLLSACVNIANLLLARGTGRLREVAVRTALGAAPRRLARQFVVENGVLAGIAAIGSVGVAWSLIHALVALAPADVPRLASVAIDRRVLVVALGLASLVTVAFGIVPVAQAWGLDVQRALAAETFRGTATRARGRTRAVLVVAEVALAVVLTVGAGLMIRSLWSLQQVDPGFHAAGVLKAEYQLPESRYPRNYRNWPHFTEIHRFNSTLLEEVARVPGVEAAALAANHPLDGGFTNSFVVLGREAEARDWPEISVRIVSPGYFPTVRVGLVRGRLIGPADDADAAPVLLVNEAAASRFFGSRDPVGQQIAFWGTPRRIVGVVADERIHGLAVAPPPAVYAPIAQNPSGGSEVLLVRGADPAALAGDVRRAIARVDPGLAVFGIEPLADTVAASQGRRRFMTELLAAFSAIALLLAAVGIHAMLTYDICERRREIGIRLALGALPSRVFRMVIGRAATLAAAGLLIGTVASLGLSRLIRGLLFEVAPGDWITLASVSAVLAVVAIGASVHPARVAVRDDVAVALRDE
jgi:predicted permease